MSTSSYSTLYISKNTYSICSTTKKESWELVRWHHCTYTTTPKAPCPISSRFVYRVGIVNWNVGPLTVCHWIGFVLLLAILVLAKSKRTIDKRIDSIAQYLERRKLRRSKVCSNEISQGQKAGRKNYSTQFIAIMDEGKNIMLRWRWRNPVYSHKTLGKYKILFIDAIITILWHENTYKLFLVLSVMTMTVLG